MAHSRMPYKAREGKSVYYDGRDSPGRREAGKDQSDAEDKKQTRVLKAVSPRSLEKWPPQSHVQCEADPITGSLRGWWVDEKGT